MSLKEGRKTFNGFRFAVNTLKKKKDNFSGRPTMEVASRTRISLDN